MKIHTPHHVQVLSHKESAKGGWIEHLKDDDPHYVQQDFLPSQRQTHREIVDSFGSATPHSSSVLLQYAGDPEQKTQATPVLLVHGSKVDGEFFFHSGLTQAMKRQGMQVFSCTFAHNHDDNFVQAQQIGNALARIREITGSPQVDVVGHSKGCVAATVYATPEFRQDWMSDYQGDVRKLLLVGGPNGGLDYFHRHPITDFGANNWPMTWTKVDGKDCREFNLRSDGHWPGQAQMVAAWDNKYPVSDDPVAHATYYGGQTDQFEAEGIWMASQEGGNFIEQLNQTPLAKDVQVGLLAGDQATVPGFVNENAGPSDGIVLVDSALQAPKDAHVTMSELLHCNHMDLIKGKAAQEKICQFLRDDANQ
jgi:triacylglycerol lipase